MSKSSFCAILALAIPAYASAACPQVTIGDGSETVRLSAEESDCSPETVFTCSKGSLRISGTVKSLTNGSTQTTAYCSLDKSEREFQKGNYIFKDVHDDIRTGAEEDN